MVRNLLLNGAVMLGALGIGTAAVAQGAATPIVVTLTGAAEVPAGDPDGTGTAEIAISPENAEVCYKLTAANIDTPTMAHIHKGKAGDNGKPVVTLDAPVGGSTDGCAPVEKALAEAMLKEPASYYVNVHTTAFPAGAVRGQLGQ